MADAETSPSAMESSTGSQMPQKHSGSTTTISTISLQSGETRLVIALLQSAERLQLKVLEGSPETTHLGATLPQALALKRQHEEVILQLQSKQSPVEELLRQADQLISAQRPRAEVYAAMAESLGVAWKDVNSYLDLRKHILDLNVSYQSRAEECIERMLALETACRDTNVPVEIEAVKNLLAKLHDFKRMMLEALMVTLQNGRALHEKMSELAAQGTLDSRPHQITSSANFSISQIEHWLEELHDRRKVLEVKWQSRKTQLEQCLSLSLLAKDLKELDEVLFLRKEALQNTSVQMGDSASSAELILHEHRKLINEAREFQDRCLKITKATEKLTLGGHFAGEQATIQAYAVLNASVEYLEALEERDALLKQSVAFFRSSRTALTKLDQIEIQLTTTEHSLTNSSLVQLHFQVSKSLDEITSQPLQKGYSLLEAVGQSAPGAQGVKCTVQELENRKISLDNLCTAHKEENIHLSKAFTAFLERQNELYSWLVSIAEAFLQGHQDLGSVLAMADDFLQLHQQLLKDLQNKGIEINDVLLTLPPILEKLNDDQRADIDEKVDTLHSHWLNLKTILESRIDLASLYVKFHSLAAELTNEFDAIEVEFRKGTDNEEEDVMSRIEQKWLYIQQMTGQLTNLGKLFIEESSKIGDPYLDVKRASLCVETLLEHFANRQLVITQSWGTWQTTITTEREFNVLWERNIRESDRIMEWISKIHSQLYPVLTGESTAAKIITKELEEKLRTIMPELKRAQTEIELRVKTAETLAMKGEHSGQKETIISKLMVLHNELNDTATDYQILLQMLISLFKKLSEVEKTIENLQSQFNMTRLPNVCSELELLLKEHEASEQTILELFKFTQNESEQIINRIVQQEPEKAADFDTQRVKQLLEHKTHAWKSAWTARKLLLEEQQQLSQFDSDLQQINSNLSDLSKQLNTLKGQYGESLTSAKATSVAFVYFEKTIQLLENRIQTFMSTTEQILKSEHASSHVESKLAELQTKWTAFMNQVKKSRQFINMNIEYFTLVEEGEKWFRVGSKLLITIARKSTAVRSPHEADQLLAEVENFLKDGELLQQERINKISSLAEELHGEEGSKQVTLVRNENKEMIDSFTIIRKELHILAQNLRAAEEQRERQEKEMEEAEAILATAKAEAAAAKAAATAAEEARRAAETAAKVLQEAMPILEKIEAETTVISSRDSVEVIERLRKSPSPPPKRAKINDEEQRSSPPTFTIPLQDATVQEGQRFTFECRVAGFPVPEVIWYKDGISIQDNPDYRTTYDNGICTLAIEETFSEDSARFTCKATNSEGSAETCATLSVQEAEPEEQLFPPVFTKRIEESSAKEGSTLYLMCTVEGNPLPTVQWFKNGTCIDNSSDYVITYNNGEAVIKFEEIFLEDQGEYTCKASNPLGTDKCSAKLTVEALELPEAPVFITPLSNIMARAGRKIQLECEVKGLPLLELIWTQNAKIIKDSQDVKLQYDNGKGVLTIKEAFPKDAGVYRVVAKNIAGEASSSCNVSVKGRLPTETSDSEIASDFEPIKPSIQLSLKDVCVLEGEKVCLDCIIIGQPEPEVIWYRNNQPVKESSDFQLLFQGDRCTLVIHEAYLEDAGEYKVVAINSGGEASSKCDLTVKSLGDVEPVVNLEVAKETQVPQGTPPKFNRLLTDIVASEGDKVVLECSIVGDPKPNVKWYLDNQELSDVTLKEYKEDGEGNMSLTLIRVESQDKGVYTIKASNAFGEAESVAKLTVNPVPSQETHLPIELEEKSIAPSFKELFADRTILENTSTKFECVVTGKPKPKVEWSINNEPISSEDVLVTTEGEQQVLTIQNVRKIHSGNVACVAENDAGRATCTARLNVVEPPISNQMHTAENIESSQKEISVKQSIFSSQVLESQSLSTTVIREEGKHVTSRSEQTLQRIEQKSPVQVQIQKFKEVQRKTNESSDSEHQSFVTAINKEESQDSSPSSYSTPTASPKHVRKSIAPRFISPLNGRIVDEGAQVILEGIIDGYPPPTVSWTKNNQELISLEGKLHINYDHNRVEVILNDATVQDAGKYTCKVVNNIGSASSTADVVVKKTFLPPIFGRRLQARSVKEGERVVLEVEITGIPDPVVTWYKNGQQILSNVPDSAFRTKVQGNCYSLIIEKVSLDYSGQYLVKAVNSKGEASSMADIVVNKQESQTETIIKVIKEDTKESEIEKLIQPQIPVSEAATEVQHPPVSTTVSEMHSNFTNTSFISEKRIISETTKTEKQTSIKLEHTPSPISFKPDAHYEIPKEHTVLAEEEKENKTLVFAPTLPVPLTQEFKTELHIDEVVERKISSPFLPTSPVKQTEKEVESQSTSEDVSPVKGDANAETSLSDQTTVKEILINLELEPTSIENNSMKTETSIFEYKSVSPSMEQPEFKAEYLEIKNENQELQENVVKPVEVLNDEPHIHHIDTVQSSEDTGVETASVTKKQAYEFFINKIKEFEEENAKPIKKPIKLPSQEVPRFTDSLNTRKEEPSHDETMYYSSIPTEIKLIPYTESMTSEFHSDQSTNMHCEKQIVHQHQLLSSDFFVEEFCVRHEPLLEIDNLSKSEIKSKSTDDASTQTKSSEEIPIHQGISPIGVPTESANVLHPSVLEELQNQTSADNIVFTSAITKENIIKKEATPSNAIENVVFPATDDGTFLSKSNLSNTPELPKEAILTKQSYMDSLTFASSKTTETLKQLSVVPEPILVPVIFPEPEPIYVEPTSTEFKGIKSETPQFSQMESHTSVCEPTDTPIPPSQPMSLVKAAVQAFNSRSISEAVSEEQIPIQPISSKPFQSFPPNTSSEGRVKEKLLKPFESKSEFIVHTSSSSIENSEIVRSVSPKPSAEGLAMEKLWIPQMTRELEITIPKSSVDQKPLDSVVSPKPSVEGLAMDKLWAHKHPDSSLKKIWPPLQHSENKPIIPWTTKATSEKMQFTVESVVDQKEEETVTMSHKSAAQEVSKSVSIPPPEPNIFQNSEAKLINREVQQVSPTFSHGKNLPPTSLLTSESGSDAPVVNAVIPTSQDAPVVHYIANASVIHSAATINQEIRTTEIFRNTEIKEEKTEVSKLVQQSQVTTNDLSSTADKCIINQYEEKKIQPVALNESFQAKSLSCVDSVPYQKEKHVIASKTLKDITKHEEKPCEEKKEKSKTLPLQKQPFQLLDLEPFPFQPQAPTKHRPAPCPPPPKPSKFIKGEFTGSDYESDFESHIPPKWRPYESDTEELTYRRVKPPLFTHSKRPKSTEPAPLPPSSFEKPLQSDGIPRPVIDKTLNVTKEIKSTSSKKTVSACLPKTYVVSKTDKVKRQQTSETSEKDLPVVLKPGSPPEYVQAIVLPKAQESQHQIVKTERLSPPKYKLDSSKSKTKTSKGELPESGYMADTDEPRQFKSVHHKSTIKHEESFKSTVEKTTLITGKTLQQSSHVTAPTHTNKSQSETKIITQPHPQSQQTQQHEHHQVHKTQQKTTSNIEKASPSKFQSAKPHHKHLENKHEQKGMSSTGSTKPKKEIISTFTSEVQKEKRDIKPVPVKPVPLGPSVKQNVRHSLPSPSKFVKGEFRESDYESDYESRIPAKWKPGDSDADEPKYKPVHPLLAQKGLSQSPMFTARTPTPPTEFDNPPEFRAPPRPKFEPIEKPSQSCKADVIRKSSGHHQKVFKPKPITPKTVPPIIATPDLKSKELEALKPGPSPEMGYAPPPPKTKINIAPFEKTTQIETSKIMNISESTEHMHRVVNVQQTTQVIRFGEKERDESDHQSETFPFKTDLGKHRTKRPVPTVPKKFVPGDFYESEYESDLEAVKIKPKWTPGNSDTEEPHYRKVRPPQITHSTRGPIEISSSHPPSVSAESNLAATTNTTQAVSIQKSEVQKKNISSTQKMRTYKSEQNRESQPIGMEVKRQQDIQLQPGEPPEFCFAGNVASVASYVSSKHMSDMTNTFRSKAQQFATDIMTDVGNSRQKAQPEKIISKQENSKDTESEKVLDDPQAYREESRVSEYGTKHIDPDTGLIYFKYDFGYEFGIVLPNEGKKQEGSTSKYPQIDRKQTGDIEVPVIHEKNTKGNENITSKATETRITPVSTKVPQFKPKKFTHFKAVKWEPASESEMSEAEGDSAKMKKSYCSPQSNLAIQKEPHIHIPTTTQWGPAPTSPLSISLSPSLPSLSPCTGATLDSTASPGGSWQGLSPIKSPRVGYGRGNTPTPPSTPSTPRSTSGLIPQHFCKPPSFITTLRDIAVMKGQPVCFECIVQAEPPPNILWAKDGRLLENSVKHQLHFRNGVCRLTLSQASPEDSGTYTCTATNKLGTVKTSGLLQVPGEKCFMHK